MHDWERLLSIKRYGLEDRGQPDERSRSQFQRDYDRIIFSSPFRRLQNKTQVFPLPGSIFVHNRLTHSLEVASVGRSLGNLLAIHLQDEKKFTHPLIAGIGDLVGAACLAHDLGNPPFGHSGEKALSRYFRRNSNSLQKKFTEEQWHDLVNFEGNANALRLLTHQFKGRRYGGYALTYSTLAAIIKYPCSSTEINKKKVHRKKFGYFNSEQETFERIVDDLGLVSESGEVKRHPLVYLVEAADDICYQVVDLEDAQRLKIISLERTINLFRNFFDKDKEKRDIDSLDRMRKEVDDANEVIAFFRAKVINKLIRECSEAFVAHYNEIMEGSFNSSLMSTLKGQTARAMAEVEEVSVKQIYNHRTVVEVELAGYKVLGDLLQEYIEALLEPDDHYNRKLLSLMPEQYHTSSTDFYERVMSVLDFISGMTDIYAVELYRKIKGISLPIIK